ncbi:MAG: DUF2203 family protein [Deltaproteobacteria bacterium]|nr:DUF2203 family protein [Deltaproteobacteria bacterium]
MAEIIELNRKKRFTLQEAQVLLPIVKKITQAAAEEVERLKRKAEGEETESELQSLVEEKIERITAGWAQKIIKLGCEPKGLWLVDFDNGGGYYCWHFPEDNVAFYHTYNDGFQKRTPIL